MAMPNTVRQKRIESSTATGAASMEPRSRLPKIAKRNGRVVAIPRDTKAPIIATRKKDKCANNLSPRSPQVQWKNKRSTNRLSSSVHSEDTGSDSRPPSFSGMGRKCRSEHAPRARSISKRRKGRQSPSPESKTNDRVKEGNDEDCPNSSHSTMETAATEALSWLSTPPSSRSRKLPSRTSSKDFCPILPKRSFREAGSPTNLKSYSKLAALSRKQQQQQQGNEKDRLLSTCNGQATLSKFLTVHSPRPRNAQSSQRKLSLQAIPSPNRESRWQAHDDSEVTSLSDNSESFAVETQEDHQASGNSRWSDNEGPDQDAWIDNLLPPFSSLTTMEQKSPDDAFAGDWPSLSPSFCSTKKEMFTSQGGDRSKRKKRLNRPSIHPASKGKVAILPADQKSLQALASVLEGL